MKEAIVEALRNTELTHIELFNQLNKSLKGTFFRQHKLVRRNRQTRPGSQKENRANFFKTSKISP